MTENLLHHLARAAESAERAWTAASNSGSQTVHSALASLHALETHANPAVPPPPPGELLSRHERYESDLQELRTTVRRLNAIVIGLKRWQDELLAQPSYHALKDSLKQLLDAFECDLEKKRYVLNVVAGDEMAYVSQREWTKYVAVWSEQPDRLGTCGDAVAAIARAEQLMDDLSKTQSDNIGSGNKSAATESRGALSPAVLALKKRLSAGS
ncbi:hypothetical protein BWQ96_05725 [Gracilariopsis chorda]|uniref:Uncharacterized protein n=1 Tax=Gracilariopsis chorda TaxID=448386 RepID=A0A2V3IS30_9FLOR|nr:hypothetical protein BWQ96_05725 [Gracilariopsis chorda]|eukprot:PXF44547.1 hypothetical protein BWQ96_05725 [Gracilariopsis chorda]